MSIVTAYKSDHDGKLFENKTDYVKHLRKLARQRLEQRAVLRMMQAKKGINAGLSKVTSIDELEEFIAANWAWFYVNGRQHSFRGNEQEGAHQLVSVKVDRAVYSNEVSNSHSAPVGGVTNFSRVTHLPMGYPGWVGDIHFTVQTNQYKYRGKHYYHQGFGSDYFAGTIINLGGGGSRGSDSETGQSKYTYQVRLYASDFPALVEARQRAQTWNVLGDKNTEFA